MLHRSSLYQSYRTRTARILLSAATFLCSLAILPVSTLVLALAAMALFGGYETVLAGLLLDALLAPGHGVLGPYHYTSILLFAVPFVRWVRSRMMSSDLTL